MEDIVKSPLSRDCFLSRHETSMTTIQVDRIGPQIYKMLVTEGCRSAEIPAYAAVWNKNASIQKSKKINVLAI